MYIYHIDHLQFTISNYICIFTSDLLNVRHFECGTTTTATKAERQRQLLTLGGSATNARMYLCVTLCSFCVVCLSSALVCMLVLMCLYACARYVDK